MAKMKPVEELYGMFRSGDYFSTDELHEMRTHFSELAKYLRRSGEVFLLSAVEAQRVLYAVESYIETRRR